MLHKEILNDNQVSLLPLVKQFGREYYLVGGTAIALYLGHRRSIDFDLFKRAPIKRKKILEVIKASGNPYTVTFSVEEQLNLIVSDVKVTFFQYEYPVTAVTDCEGVIKIPSLLDLAAMKAFALGRRSKWKDYVDLYFLLNGHFTISEIAERASEIFGDLFSDKLFRAQLAFFADVDYSEEVDYLVANPPSDESIQEYLKKIATDLL